MGPLKAHKYFAIFLLLICSLCSAISSTVYADSLKTSKGFWKCLSERFQIEERVLAWKQSREAYYEDFRKTWGLRLLFSPAKERSGEALLGVFTTTKPTEKRWYRTPISSVIQAVPKLVSKKITGTSYDFTPFKIINAIPNKLIGGISQKIGQKRELSLLVTLPVEFYIFYKIYDYFDQKYKRKLQLKLEDQVKIFSKEYDKLIREDFRFKDIYEYLQEGKITEDQSRVAAQQLLAIYNNYYRYMEKDYSDEKLETSTDKLLHSPLFYNLNQVVTKGVPENEEGFQRKSTKSAIMNLDLKTQLLAVNHILFEKYQLIPELVNNTSIWRQMAEVKERKEMAEAILSDPFIKKLKELKNSGKISQAQLIYAVQEDAFWQSKFQMWDLSGLIRLKKVSGKFTKEPLTLNDIRKETIEDLNAK